MLRGCGEAKAVASEVPAATEMPAFQSTRQTSDQSAFQRRQN